MNRIDDRTADPAASAQMLQLAADLWRRVDELDLDAIDAAFYWRCCRPDFAAAVDALRDLLPERPLKDYETALDVRGLLTEGVHRLSEAFGVPHQLALAHVTEGDPVRMRGHAIVRQWGVDPTTPEP